MGIDRPKNTHYQRLRLSPQLEPNVVTKRHVQVQIKDENSDDITTSAAEGEEPKPPTPEPPEPESSKQIPQTPYRTHTPGEFPVDTPIDAIHVRPPEPQPQEEA